MVTDGAEHVVGGSGGRSGAINQDSYLILSLESGAPVFQSPQTECHDQAESSQGGARQGHGGEISAKDSERQRWTADDAIDAEASEAADARWIRVELNQPAACVGPG